MYNIKTNLALNLNKQKKPTKNKTKQTLLQQIDVKCLQLQFGLKSRIRHLFQIWLKKEVYEKSLFYHQAGSFIQNVTNYKVVYILPSGVLSRSSSSVMNALFEEFDVIRNIQNNRCFN